MFKLVPPLVTLRLGIRVWCGRYTHMFWTSCCSAPPILCFLLRRVSQKRPILQHITPPTRATTRSDRRASGRYRSSSLGSECLTPAVEVTRLLHRCVAMLKDQIECVTTALTFLRQVNLTGLPKTRVLDRKKNK